MSTPPNTPTNPDQATSAGYDWDDPHHFHAGAPVDEDGHHHEEHHVASWQGNVVVLFALLFFTFLTVYVAAGEVLLTTYTDIPITQLWNVIIAMGIATVKAMLVCMYFMHLRHDKALNTMVLLFTFATMGMFMAMPAIDVASRGNVKPFAQGAIEPGGTGVGMSRMSGEDITGSIVTVAREKKIAEVGEEEYWKKFYYYKAKYKPHKQPKRHKADENNHHAKWLAAGGADHDDKDGSDHAKPAIAQETSSANRSIVRTGLTPGLFDDHAGDDTTDDHDHDAEANEPETDASESDT